MSTILLKTKIHIPIFRSDQVLRSRLIAGLNQGVRGKLTLISTPAGFGKTTLISSWIRKSGMPTAWFSVDKDDNDPVRFWVYFVNALQTIQPGIGGDFLTILTASQSPPNEALLVGLINEIEAAQARFAFVLDDFHLINNQQVQTALLFLLNHLPPQMHIIISSRADPPWPLARLRTRNELTEIRADDLRFTFDETGTLLNGIMGLNVSAEDIARLENRTEGWIVGLQMAALSMQNREDISGFIQAFTGTHRFILDYLLEEVLGRQSAEIQEFLLKTSILHRMSGPLCDSVMDRSGSQMVLVQLEHANLFLVPLDDDRLWYRYHHLFAELLRNQLNLLYPDDVLILHQRASQWFGDQGFTEEAIEHAFAAQDDERVARLIEKYALSMLQQNKHSQLSSWIEALPEDVIRNRPWLCVFQSWTRHWAGIREGGEACLEEAQSKLECASALSPEEARILPGYIATVRAHYALVNGEIARVVEQARKALDILPVDDYYARGTAAIALGGAYWGMGDLIGAEDAFAECAIAALKGGYPFRASSALCYQGMIQVRQGQLLKAEKSYQEALDLGQDSAGRRYPVAGYALAKLAELACEWNDLERARRDAGDGVDLCNQLGHVDLIAEAYAALARVQLAQEDYAGATETLQETTRLSQESTLDPWAICWLDDCYARLCISTEKLDEAVRWMDARGLRADSEFDFHHDLHHVNLARVRVAQLNQDPHEVDREQLLDLLTRLLKVTTELGWVDHRIKTMVLQAVTYQVYGNTDEALLALTQALTLAEPSGYVRVFLDEGSILRSLLYQICAQGDSSSSEVPSAYAAKILSAFDGGDLKRRGKATLVEPLTPREKDVLGLLTTNMSVPEIAAELVVSANTVRTHVKRIYDKLGVNRRLGAVQKAKDLDLV